MIGGNNQGGLGGWSAIWGALGNSNTSAPNVGTATSSSTTVYPAYQTPLGTFGQHQLIDPALYHAFLKWQSDQITAEAERKQPPVELVAKLETALDTMEAMLLYVKEHPGLDDQATWFLELRDAHRRVKAFHAMLSAKVLSERLDG